ncbi:MAG TPA: P22 phage major capsid protein family protein [Bryobacteraceae bacterium]
MANQLLTRQEITRESLMVLENELHVVKNFYRDLDQEFGKKGGKIGSTIFVRKPPRAIGRDGQQYQPEGMTDTEVPVAINQQSGVDFEFSSAEKFLSIDEFKQRYLDPYMIALANKLDYRCALTAMQNTANFVGTPGTTPGLNSTDAFLIYRQAGQKLDEMGFPLEGGRTMVITPAMVTGWLDFAKAFFNPTGALSKQWKQGQVSNALGYEWYTDQNIATQVIGALGGTPAVNGASQTGTSLITNGWTASVSGLLSLGDVISITGVYAVNPQNRNSTGSLQQFVVQATANSDSGGNSTLSIMPAIVPSGQFQNVTASPASGALINVYNTAAAGQSALSGVSTPQGLLFHRQAFAFVSFPGDVPEGVDMGYEDRSPDVGVSLRFVRIWDGYRDQWVNRFDVYYGIAPLYMEGACRISS